MTATPRESLHLDRNHNDIKRLELLGGLGAGVLGAGIALLFADWLAPFAIPALIAGALTHGWAMYAKNRAERRSGVRQPAWEIAAYWICRLLLAVLFLLVALR